MPVASLTKMMTAYLVLTDHPLSATEQGPSFTMTAADVADWDNAVDTDQSNVEVALGEVLTERQLLEGLLVHSANNFADILAEWDAGSMAAFVTKMNATALTLGMTQYALRRRQRLHAAVAVDALRPVEGRPPRHGVPGLRPDRCHALGDPAGRRHGGQRDAARRGSRASSG